VAEVVNRDPETSPFLKVVFLPDYNVKNSRKIFPAADLSEQISTAGKEASGTGNMKFGLNGALTIGTFDGANIEIREEVGIENFFLFGLKAEEVKKRKAWGYRPRDHYESDPRLRAALDLIGSGFFSGGDRSLFQPLLEAVLERDDYMVCADFSAYLARQDEVAQAYRDRERWTRMSIMNVSRMGKFSSDRTIAEYCRDIWHVEPVAETKRNG
jgi:starch phosphorylase